MAKRYQSKSGTRKPKRQKQYRNDAEAPIVSHGIMTGMTSNFRNLVSVEQRSGSRIGKYFVGALLLLAVFALIIWGLR